MNRRIRRILPVDVGSSLVVTPEIERKVVGRFHELIDEWGLTKEEQRKITEGVNKRYGLRL